MFPNQEQFLSWVKTTLGLISGILGAAGVSTGTWWVTVSAVVLAVAPYLWGWLSNTKLAQIKQAETLPDAAKVVIAANVPGVSQVLLKPTVSNGLAEAAADPGLPKVSIAPPFAVTPR